VLATVVAGSAAAFQVPVDPGSSTVAEGFGWANDPTGTTPPDLTHSEIDSVQGFVEMDLTSGGNWSFDISGDGINFSGLTPTQITSVTFLTIRYVGSVPVEVTPLAGGQFLVEQAASSVADVEFPREVFWFDVNGNISFDSKPPLVAELTDFQCVVDASGGGTCDLTIGPRGFHQELNQGETITWAHGLHLVIPSTVPEPNVLPLIGALGLAIAVGRRRRARARPRQAPSGPFVPRRRRRARTCRSRPIDIL
jgi:hypothetical protein